MDIGAIANPFRTWAPLARGLRDRFAVELGQPPYSSYTGDVLGRLTNMIGHCEQMGMALDRLAEKDPQAFEAFLRSLEKS